MQTNVSIKDIAKKLGIAPSTVSRALNGIYGVNAQTRDKVLDAARELGYVPNVGAKALAEKRSRLVGIVMPVTEAPHQLPLFSLTTINRSLTLHGRDTVVNFIERTAYVRGDLERLCRSRNLEGVIVMAGFGARHGIYNDATTLTTPAVVYSEDVVGRSCSSIGTDDVAGAGLAVSHLYQLGHRRIGFVNGPEWVTVSKKRLTGYLMALNDLGIPVDESLIVHSDFSGPGGFTSTAELLRRDHDLTAIFYANDLMAMGGINALHERGISIPNDIAVVGYDDVFFGDMLVPPLTTIRHSDQVSVRAVSLLIALMHGETGRMEHLRPELIIRSSDGHRGVLTIDSP